MEDTSIIALYNARSEDAIAASREKYGRYCFCVARNVLGSDEDAEDAEMDGYLRAWNTIPPQKPRSLCAYLAALVRRAAIDMLRLRTADKRGGEYENAADELDECAPSGIDGRDFADNVALRDALDSFLATLGERPREVFMRRYWWSSSVSEIARDLGMSEAAVKMQLSRLREKLKKHLETEGF